MFDQEPQLGEGSDGDPGINLIRATSCRTRGSGTLHLRHAVIVVGHRSVIAGFDPDASSWAGAEVRLSGPGEHATPAAATALDHVASSLERDIERLSVAPQGDKPVTLSIGEPFTTTVTFSFTSR